MRRTIITSLLTATLAFGVSLGCGGEKTGETGEAPEADKTEAAAPAVDKDAVKTMLQGAWSVKSPKDKELFSVKVTGDDIEFTDLRFGTPKTQKGKLVVESDSVIGVKEADGTTYKYAYAKIGDKLHLGMGTVLKADNLDAFELKIEMFEKIVKDAKGCRWVKTFGGKDETRDVKCEVADKDGQKVLKYQVPDSFKPEELSDRELYVFGDVLVDEQLLESVAHKQ